jgi:sulfate adenylyltransferase subunit 1 (EFTu-like GTPase family)
MHPYAALVDHPGVWEKAGHAYLNEVLVSRCGIPAALAIVLADLVRQLLLQVRRHWLITSGFVSCQGAA